MANLFFTGFEGITAAQILRRFSSTAGSATIASGSGRFGNGVQLPAASGRLVSPVFSGVSEIITGFAMRLGTSGFAFGRIFLELMNGATPHVSAQWNITDNKIEVLDAGGTVRVSSANGSVPIDTWVYVELRAVVSDTVGVLEFRLNGVVVGTVTGLDTRSGATTTVDRVQLRNSTNSSPIDFDDWYINDTTGPAPHNTFYGDVRVDRIDTAADSTVQFTPLSGSNESNIDDANTPDDDTSYNSSTTVAHRDLFTVSGYVPPSGTILGVAVRAMGRTADAGSRTVRAMAKSGATDSLGTAASASLSYQEFSHVMYNDPDTAAPFANAAAVNALLIGYEIVS